MEQLPLQIEQKRRSLFEDSSEEVAVGRRVPGEFGHVFVQVVIADVLRSLERSQFEQFVGASQPVGTVLPGRVDGVVADLSHWPCVLDYAVYAGWREAY